MVESWLNVNVYQANLVWNLEAKDTELGAGKIKRFRTKSYSIGREVIDSNFTTENVLCLKIPAKKNPPTELI